MNSGAHEASRENCEGEFYQRRYMVRNMRGNKGGILEKSGCSDTVNMLWGQMIVKLNT